jgi:hypothetical protein
MSDMSKDKHLEKIDLILGNGDVAIDVSLSLFDPSVNFYTLNKTVQPGSHDAVDRNWGQYIGSINFKNYSGLRSLIRALSIIEERYPSTYKFNTIFYNLETYEICEYDSESKRLWLDFDRYTYVTDWEEFHKNWIFLDFLPK